MRTQLLRGFKRRSVLLAGVALFGALSFYAPKTAPADAPEPIMKIEEDWVVQIIEPDSAETSPQITNTLSPTGCLHCTYGVFEVNHGTQPDYKDGGLELQIWDHEERVNFRRHTNNNRLGYSGEQIKYTVAMSLRRQNDDGSDTDNYRLRFTVRNGTSQTWGNFGTGSTLRCSIDAEVSNLDLYDPAFSVANSRVGFASFRVRKYALVAVRYYDSDGHIVRTDNTERVCHAYNGDVDISE